MITHLEHDGVDLFLDLLVGQYNAVLASLNQEVEERLPLLLANVVLVYVQVVLQSSRLSEGQTLDGGGVLGGLLGHCGGVDKVALAALVVVLLLGYDLLGQAVDDVEQADLLLAVLGQVEQPVGPQPDLGVTQMEDVAHPV